MRQALAFLAVAAMGTTLTFAAPKHKAASSTDASAEAPAKTAKKSHHKMSKKKDAGSTTPATR